MFRLWYPSNTQLAVQQSQKYIDNYNKMNAQRVESTLKYHEQERQLYLEKVKDQRLNSTYQNRSVHTDNNYTDQLIKREKERIIAKQERQRLQKIENDRVRKVYKNKQADLEHIRSENMKTCKYWTSEYKLKPTPQNESYKKTSCERAYSR